MKKISLFLVLFLSVICGYSQNFEKYFGGSSADGFRSIQQTTDGGYICAGYSHSNNGDATENHGLMDAWIVKLTYSGSIQWQRSLGGTFDDEASSIIQTTDGGYIMAGTSISNDGDVNGENRGGYDYWIVKLTSAGSIQWQRSLGGTLLDSASSILQATDGGYIIGGYTGSNNGDVNGYHGLGDYWVVKLTSTGSIQWQKSLGGSNEERATMQKTTDGGCIVTGYTFSNDGDATGNHGNSDMWVVKLTGSGSIEWKKCLGGTMHERANSVVQTIDGGYIIAGSSNSNSGDVTGENHGSYDYWIVKLTNTGSIQWQRSLGGAFDEYAYSIQQTSDDGYIITGYSSSIDGDVTGNQGGLDTWVVKLTSTGIIQWEKSFGGAFSEFESTVLKTANNGYIIVVRTDPDNDDNNFNEDLWVIKLSNSGTIQHEQTYGTVVGQDISFSIELTTDSGFIIVGTSNSPGTGNHGSYDGWIIKAGSTLSTDESTLENLFSVYPNPANSEIHVNTNENTLGLPYTIYDQSGRSVLTGKLNEHDSVIKIHSLSKGTYILGIGDKIKTSRKIIKE